MEPIKTIEGLRQLGSDRGLTFLVREGKGALRVTEHSDRYGILRDVADYHGFAFDGDLMRTEILALPEEE